MMKKLLFLGLFISIQTLSSQTALNFDGINDIILGTNNTSLQLTRGTVEAWIETGNPGSHYRGIIVKQYNYGIFLFNNNLIAYNWLDAEVINTNINLADDTWHHVALVFDDGVTNGSKLYIDGLPKLTFTYNIKHLNAPITIGNNENQSHHFNGNIDQVRVWNTVRTDAEILATYNKCLSGYENGLAMLWQFEEGVGLTATDLSGNNNHGTLTNMDSADWVNGYDCSNLVAYYPFNGNANDESGSENNGTVHGATLTTDRFGNTDSAYSFDGIDAYIQVPNNNSLDIYNRDLTISMWLYNDNPLTDSSWKGISKGGFDTGAGYELIFTNNTSNSNGKLGLNIGSSGYNVGSFNTYNDQWIMLTGTYENGIRKVYINGIEQTTTAQGSDTFDSSTSDLYIGTRSPGNSYTGFVKGKIDEVRIYNKALTDTEVSNLFTNTALKIEKFNNVSESNFYVFENTLHFKKIQNLNDIESVEVYNLLGQKVYKTSTIKNEIIFKTIPIGVYILKVKNIDNNIYTLRFLIN